MGILENLSHGVSLSKLPIFPVFLHILIRFRSESNFLADFISIEEISVLYIRDSYFTNVQTNIEAKILIFFLSHGFSLSKLLIFLVFAAHFYF